MKSMIYITNYTLFDKIVNIGNKKRSRSRVFLSILCLNHLYVFTAICKSLSFVRQNRSKCKKQPPLKGGCNDAITQWELCLRVC